MSLFDGIQLVSPYLRVKNRQETIDFYRDVLGFKTYHEENALALIGDQTRQKPLLTVEVSKSLQARPVSGPKKLALLEFWADSRDIAELLARKVPVDQVVKGPSGYGFYTTSPDGDPLLIHGEADRNLLEPVAYPDVTPTPEFSGLNQVNLISITLHATEPKQLELFFKDLPIPIIMTAAQGEDLNCPNTETLDLESLEFTVSAETDLRALAEHFTDKGAEVFLNRKATYLIVTASNGIELWFLK